MSFLKDALAIFKKTDLPFICKVEEAPGVYSFLFKKTEGLSWHPGQHGLFTITHKKVKAGTKPFTIASTPEEGVVKLTTKISDSSSDFKKALLELKEGMTIRLSGPVGSFYMKDNNPSLFIAGGIGVTPFRGMINRLKAEGREQQARLLYVDSQQLYVYKEELEQLPSLEVVCLPSREGLNKEVDEFIQLHGQNGTFYVAGSKSMVQSVCEELKKKGIDQKQIKRDTFLGIS